jgi:tetratricopeptide (TPR) repeat protein
MEDILRKAHIPALAALLAMASSCSWYRDLERSLVEDESKSSQRSKTVPREQYDQLLVKYEELSKKYEELKENPNANKPSLVDELQTSQGENFAGPSNVETVDVFPGAPETAAANVPADIESQLSLYRRGVMLKKNNPGEATKIFQQLENQAIPAIRVRSKFEIGELLFNKEQYDLALQVFEDIIYKSAHSGVVLAALKHAIVCSEKLGIQNKKDQYASMLHDVFETK